MNEGRTFPLQRVAGLFLVAGGLWHAAAPWIFGYSVHRDATISNLAAGLTLAVVGVLMLVLRGGLWLCGIAGLIGVWVMISPQVFGLGGPHMTMLEAIWGGPLTIVVATVAALDRSWGTISGTKYEETMERGTATA